LWYIYFNHFARTLHSKKQEFFEEKEMWINKLIMVMLVFVLVLTGCAAPSATQTPAGVAVTEVPPPTEAPVLPTPTAGVMSLEMIRNGIYQLNGTNQPRQIKLVNGAFVSGSGADFVSARLGDLIATGDLNGDAQQDAAAVVGENYGGTGVFTFLAVLMNQEGKPVHQFSALIDDRPQITGIQIEDGQIILDAIVHDVDDPMCCPTFPVTRTYQLTKSGLTLARQTSKTPTGAERAITITSPKNGEQVSGSVQLSGEVTIAPFENNLVYKIVDEIGKELASGPITVNADGLGGPGTFDSPIDLSAVPAGSIIRILISDISMVDGSTLAMDSVVVLVK
jgi:hypothetical protein